MKHQALLLSKDKSKKLNCRLLQIFIWRFNLETHFGGICKQCIPDQMQQKAASDQGLHCLVIVISLQTANKMKTTTGNP